MRRNQFGLTATTIAATTILGMTTALAATTTVQQGQTMWSIAQARGLSLQSIEAANPHVIPDALQVGMQLQLPATFNYRIQAGDTFFTISQKSHVNLNSIKRLNSAVNPLNLRVGSLIRVPIQASSSPSASTPSTTYETTSASPTGTVQAQNLYWMEHAISAEANAEPLQAQIGVGDVIMHRLEAGSYGHTVKDVVFQISNGHYQFTSVENGFIYSKPTSTSIQAAKDVISKHQDVVPGAFVFYNPAKTPASSWVRRQPTMRQIGAFVFAK